MLNRLKVSQKVLIAPLAVLIVLLAFATLAFITVRGQLATTNRLVDETHAASLAAENLVTIVSDAHADIMRLMVWNRMDRPQEDLDGLMASITTAMEDLPAAHVAVNDVAGSAHRTALADMEPLIADFRSVGGNAATMALVNPALAAAVVTGATERYTELRGEIDALLAELAVESEATTAMAEQRATQMQLLLAACIVIAVFGSAIVTITIGRHITNGLRSAVAAIDALADGDLDAPIPNADRPDELGDISRGLVIFRRKLRERTEREANDRRRQEADAQSVLLGDLADTFESSVTHVTETLASSATELGQAADNMSAMAGRSSTGARDVMSATESAAEEADHIRGGVSDLNDATRAILDRATESTTVVSRAVNRAEDTNATLADLSEAAQRIGDVIKLITEIAEQTNLLALNATIEAARAGEAGRGFAVVAQEVKSLASQTAEATDDIRRQIQGIQSATADSVAAIKGVTAVIGEISAGTDAIRTSAEQQNDTTDRMTDAVGRVADSTARAVEEMRAVMSAVEETSEIAGHVQQASRHLSQETETLSAESRQFIDGIRQQKSGTTS
ncbi:methyl-accepting chemotaxis protein [Fodinicurvata sp. EGI_FJ10296]|uniref:methyl-accepting chemotaxis protein n=1 Tax=Fodinicurvata sp. EGI_FJ10296 TaxID=3231908 RepID=UPI003453E235